MRVHISLDLDKVPDQESRRHAIADIIDKASLRDVNQKRAERYGVITADVEPKMLDQIRGMDLVSACEVDSVQKAL
jgi:hypothetical protein